jgi:predicted RNA-binding Zn-ribbon protein involved in translation (DUF1610 family)
MTDKDKPRRKKPIYVCQFCGYEGSGFKNGGFDCPKCGRTYDAILAQDYE